ncbi:MAG: DNA-3-methyladenine glycosylase 2 family protein [Blautia sp.]|nr:DNA-3-methyladenine glycosylase 2 family protein [Blautia sp.]
MIKKLDHFDISKIAMSGQCFRIHQDGNGIWTAVADDKVLLIHEIENDGKGRSTCDFDCSDSEFDAFWTPYFDLDTDYEAFCRLVDPDDEYLNAAVDYGRGIRILKQDLWEVTISFIISQRKSIPSISSCIEKISSLYGPEITDGIHAFPSPDVMAMVSEDELRSCALGYRAPYIHKTSQLILESINSGEDFIQTAATLSDEEVIDRLKQLPGVGIKVSNCISLFGLHRLAAFPRDTWILRIEDKYYGGHFPEEKYPGCAGLMQQYMFFYEKRK